MIALDVTDDLGHVMIDSTYPLDYCDEIGNSYALWVMTF